MSAAWMFTLALAVASDGPRDEHFEQRIRPLLAERCYECHSGATKRPKGALRVDSLEALLRGGSGGAALVPGKPDESLLVHALRYADAELQMPPTGKLPDAEIELLAQWIADGAHWPGGDASATAPAAPSEPWAPTDAQRAHWAFQPLRAVEPPRVDDAEWSRHPLDRFVKAELDARGLAPAPRADRRELYLRASFDLLGLPPERAELDAFVADAAPDAWERAVDRLLASPHYGERQARRWLDVARYADSNGVDENLAMSEAWRYRDWLVRAYNADLPYDRFLTWQLAGDLVERDELDFDPLIATAFLALGPKMLAEQDKPKLQADVVDEQLDVASRAFLGLTMGCARCHDHKFDPLPATDYYALAGVFHSTATLANTNFVSRWNERPLGTRAEIARRDEHAAAEAAAKKAVDALLERGAGSTTPESQELRAAYARAGAALAPRALLLEAEDASRGNLIRDDDTYGSRDDVLARTGKMGLQHVEWDVALPAAARWRLFVRYAAEESRPVVLALGGAARANGVLGAVTGGWKPDALAWADLGALELAAGRNVLRFERDGAFPHLDALVFVPEAELCEALIGAASVPEFAAAHVATAKRGGDVEAAPYRLPQSRREAHFPAALRTELAAARARVAELEQGRAPALPAAIAVAEAAAPIDARVHVRGSHLAQAGEPIARGPLHLFDALVARPAIAEGASGRLELARWMLDPAHPLTSRVAANRIWAGLFGRGIAASPSNFGLRGDAPTHPALLDWLARELVANGWSQKRLQRLILTSRTWQMASAPAPASRDADPDARWLSHFARRRLDAESLRDRLLCAAGTLDRTLGGSLLGTPNGDYVTNDQSGNAARYEEPRRSLYLPIVRNAMYELFSNFDYADPSVPLEPRPTTNVPSQALFFLNSPLVEGCARKLAERALARGEPAARVRELWSAALLRDPTADELARSLALVERLHELQAAPAAEPVAQGQRHEMPGAHDERELRAWLGLARALLSSNEFLYVD
ncbi:MAG: DUF1553 domain-containing protein [Planctomycetota bacterium]|nr:MAG: DUF1553 domain-containing protein [Planctomycetota bacterium]